MNPLTDVLEVVGLSLYKFLALEDVLRFLRVSRTTKDLSISQYKWCIEDIFVLIERWKRGYYLKKVLPLGWTEERKEYALELFNQNVCFVVNTAIEVRFICLYKYVLLIYHLTEL